MVWLVKQRIGSAVGARQDKARMGEVRRVAEWTGMAVAFWMGESGLGEHWRV